MFNGSPVFLARHAYAMLPSVAARLRDLDKPAFGAVLERVVRGTAPGLVCYRCGMTHDEICLAGALLIDRPLGSMPAAALCMVRPRVVEQLLEMDRSGQHAEVCFDILRRETSFTGDSLDEVRNAMFTRLTRTLANGGSFPVLGCAE